MLDGDVAGGLDGTPEGELGEDGAGELDGDGAGKLGEDADGDAKRGSDGDTEGDRDEDAAGNPDRDVEADGKAASAELDRDAAADVAGAVTAAAPVPVGCVTTLLSVDPGVRDAVPNRHAVIDPASSTTTATAMAETTRPGRRQRPAVVSAAIGAVIETLPGACGPGPS